MGLLRAEWLKLRSVRSNLVMLGVIVILGVGFGALLTGVVQARAGRGGDISPLLDPYRRVSDLLFSGVGLASVLSGVFAVHLVGQEYRFSTIRATFVAVPHRLRVMASKFGALMGTLVVVLAVTEVGAYLVGGAILSSRGYPIVANKVQSYQVEIGPRVVEIHRMITSAQLHRLLIGVFLVGLVFAIAGFGVGMIVRQPIGGIILVLAWPVVVENIVVGFLKSSAGKWMPYNAGSQLLEQTKQQYMFGPWAGFFYFLGFAVLLCVIGAVLTNRRDA